MTQLPNGSKKYLQLTGAAMEMGVLIFLGLWIGKQIDKAFLLTKPWFTLLFTLLFLAAAIYRMIRQVNS